MKILAVSGSLRKGSSNTAILKAAVKLSPSAQIQLYPSLGDLPYFNPDRDLETCPPAVKNFRDLIAASDALLISTPEYAHGIPGALKNALDWLVSDPRFAGKKIGLIFGSATEGTFAQTALLEVLKTMSVNVIPQAIVNIPGVRVKFDPQGKLLDAEVRDQIKTVLTALGV